MISYLLWLSTRKGIAPGVATRLLEHFGTAEAVYYADQEECALLQLGEQLQASLADKSMDGVEQILERCDRQGISLLSCQDGAYPERLRQLYDYPLVLYVKGRLFRFDEELAIAMVGARKCTPYGVTVAGRMGMELARGGALVISGLAQGIDAAALRGALQGGGPVVSVLAGGVDVIYPKENQWLYQDVAAAGAILSENPPGTRPEGWRFPLRNRIISGLSVGVVAVEAAENRSGTLITARAALEQDRDVFAVPGPADAPMSGGTNLLIARGEAKLVRSAWDVLSEYRTRFPRKLRQVAPLCEEEAGRRLETSGECQSPTAGDRRDVPPSRPLRSREDWERMGNEQREIFSLLQTHKLTADEIVGRSEIPARRVNSALTFLQAWGYIEELPGRRFTAAVRFDEDQV